ncbi:unnamed protein product [Cyprideis torosa]|uniref:Uncharacterized protein n=1 Tax=Cyprideis torosa TaxID=163714 RepID=A0A7R8ZKR3_9CRUS|nr:unnamed protein product [Cyprideis torosa]CAG0884976.1 unnamed protein product [Cyprideis torosa]
MSGNSERIVASDPETFSVTILFTGYAIPVEHSANAMRANCSCVLLRGDNDVCAIVDPLTPWDKDKLIEASGRWWEIAFQEETFTKQLISEAVCNWDTSATFPEINIGGLRIVSTPGHTQECVTVLAKTHDYGLLAIAGDLFENENDVSDPSQWLSAGSWDPETQRKSRYHIATLADTIVPGHGQLFRVTEDIRNKLREQC